MDVFIAKPGTASHIAIPNLAAVSDERLLMLFDALWQWQGIDDISKHAIIDEMERRTK